MTPLPAPSPVPPVIYQDRKASMDAIVVGSVLIVRSMDVDANRGARVSLPPPFDPSLITLSALCASGRASVEGVR